LKKFSIFMIVVLFLLGLVIRTVDLECDPPAFFAGGGQALTTDAAHLTHYAKNRVQFGQWDLFGYQPWTAFKISLVTALSWLLYSLFGVSRVVTNLTGVILNFTGIALFLIALRKYLNHRALIYCTLFLMCNFLAAVYARLPFSENGLIFLAGLAFLVYAHRFDTLTGKILTGGLIALCGLLGKVFGFLIGAGPVAYLLLYESGRERLRSALAMAGSAAAVIVIFSLTFPSEGGLSGFLWEHAAGAHGFPGGLQSVGGFFEHLIGATAYSRLHVFTPVTSLLAYLFFVTLILNMRFEDKSGRGILFLASWLLVSLVVMSPFNYVPLRYQYALTIPIATVAGFALDSRENLFAVRRVPVTISKAVLLLLLNWYLAYCVIRHTATDSKIMAELYGYVWYALPIGVIITAGQLAFFSRRRLKPGPRLASVTVIVAISLFCLVSLWRYVDYAKERTYNIAEANRDVAQILSPEAVVSGQYGPALSADTPLRSLPFYVTGVMTDPVGTFKDYPVTHFAVSASDWKKWCERYPAFQKASVIARYWIRDNIVYLVRTAGILGNTIAAEYQLSDYEEAVRCINAGHPDSALIYLNRSLALHSQCKSALLELYYLIAEHGDLQEATPVVGQLVSDFPTDFSTHMIAAIFYKSMAQNTGVAEYTDMSRQHLETAVGYNPVNSAVLRRMYDRYPVSQRIVK